MHSLNYSFESEHHYDDVAVRFGTTLLIRVTGGGGGGDFNGSSSDFMKSDSSNFKMQLLESDYR